MIRNTLLILVLIFGFVIACAKNPEAIADYSVVMYGNGSTGDFAPYFLGSLNHGKYTQKYDALLDAYVGRSWDPSKKFSWGFGVEGVGGYFSGNEYEIWRGYTIETPDGFGKRKYQPRKVRLQQLYAEAKYRCLFLSAGMKERISSIVNQKLSSGDLTESGNARPIPEVRAGFIDFQNVPFTKEWLQIQGEVSYGKLMDDDYLRDTYNYFTGHFTEGSLFQYKRVFLRTNPEKRLSVTAGLQASTFFGGKRYIYNRGKVVAEREFSKSLWTFIKVTFPLAPNGEDFFLGQTTGCWNLRARYRFKNDAELIAYFQGPFEDGSGIGRCNKMDGLWGLEYKAAHKGWLNGAVIEYIDFRDQSGPIYWVPEDAYPGLQNVFGADGYYNNSYYNSYAYYGMSLGTPFLISPKYNLDGFIGFACNRANGFHIGAMGNLSNTLEYILKIGYQRGLGTYNHPYHDVRTTFSMMLQMDWDAAAILPGLSARMQIGFDKGDLRGDNFGTSFSIAYTGQILSR